MCPEGYRVDVLPNGWFHCTIYRNERLERIYKEALQALSSDIDR